MTDRPLRVMWLLNHTTARKFEIPMLKRIGVQEIFLPKKYPADPALRSASVDWSEDEHLTIPKDDLAILNDADWYHNPGIEAWQIASRHFDVAFFILLKTDFLKSMSRHFKGAKIWRTYGLPNNSYHAILDLLAHREAPVWSSVASKNLWFGQAYAHLAAEEPHFIAKKAVLFPVGLADASVRDEWNGDDKRIFFICPDLAFNSYYENVYRRFRKTFGGLPYVVGGAQPISVSDSHVLGYLPSEQHRQNMRQLRVMYYHGTEPNHIHYHPFEAVRSGMPLVFMAGGLLDRLGGIDLPGRSKTPKEARQKVERILSGDRRLIDSIRQSQQRLLEPMKADACEADWRAGLGRVLGKLRESSPNISSANKPKKRIAVLLPAAYRGGSLRGAKLLARAIATGSRMGGEDIEVVFGHLDDPACYPKEAFEDLPASIKRRPYRWRTVSHDEAVRACAYAGLGGSLQYQTYQAPDDGISQFTDCDLWIVISDRLLSPPLPIRPYLLMIYDYLQRYQTTFDDDTNQKFVARAHAAEAVMVTTAFTASDARQFAGIPAKKIKKVPMLAPEFFANPARLEGDTDASFLWTTNLNPHKNHENAFKALRLYYEKYEGTLNCHVTGVDTGELLKRDARRLRGLRDICSSSAAMKQHLKIEGELPEERYQAQLGRAAFLWHPGRIDNGTFSVVEAAHLGVPALSSDYPAMREIDQQFALNLTWMDPDDPDDMAHQLKRMETNFERARRRLPSAEELAGQSVDRLAGAYWSVIKDYL
ncbi:glycosyltransferase [Bradyrhizobium lablabi]|uniref:glycosyltransferase n=1 Tax=Bradyrhizobium lablabi TaxID=722472 RepID=UPI001BAB0929|nr:glycosyltransferase [Bradyrhizobium lablabi]MBR0693269.1 glycosyltransferase [Bradyrhizobium lablabi]